MVLEADVKESPKRVGDVDAVHVLDVLSRGDRTDHDFTQTTANDAIVLKRGGVCRSKMERGVSEV